MRQVRILSFNTLYNAAPKVRLRALAETLAESDYDVVCLQELWILRNFRMFRSLTTDSFPYAAHGLRFPTVAGGLLTLSRIPLVGHRYVTVAEKQPWRRETLLRKGVLITRLAVDGEFLTVANTHLSANHHSDWSKAAPFTKVQERELATLAGHLRKVDSGEPVVVVGDFNVRGTRGCSRGSWPTRACATSSRATRRPRSGRCRAGTGRRWTRWRSRRG
ncbi:endonuclease/exonuclease/phosphatase family protein [Catenulispora yoronensis]